jgi:hypothetical protein
VLGLVGIVIALLGGTSITSYIKHHYHYVGRSSGAQVYSSSQSVVATAHDLINHDDPGDRRTTESGVFLRYPRTFVAVLPSGSGSRIEVANQNAGYTMFYNYVGGYWGTYSGPAASFRGGGPGAGK